MLPRNWQGNRMAYSGTRSRLKKNETELLKVCWSDSGSEPGVGDKGPVQQDRDSGTVKRRGSFLRKQWLDLVTCSI